MADTASTGDAMSAKGRRQGVASKMPRKAPAGKTTPPPLITGKALKSRAAQKAPRSAAQKAPRKPPEDMVEDAVDEVAAAASAAATDATTATRTGRIPPKSKIGKKSTAKPRSVNSDGKQKKAHRFRPGTVALREIRRYQKSTDLLIQKKPFQRLIREIAQDRNTDMRFQKAALNAIQEAAEMYLTNYFESSNVNAIHAKRVTLMMDDMKVTKYQMDKWGSNGKD